jgi:colicin import membrane protein
MDETKTITGELITSKLSDSLIVFHVSDSRIAELRNELEGLRIAGAEDYAKAVKGIAICRTLRSQVEKCRKELKEDSLTYGRKVDAEAKRLTAKLEEIEEPLKLEKARVDEEKEKVKREAEEARRRKFESRINALADVGARANHFLVSEWSDEEFASQLESAKVRFEEAQQQSKLEAERLAKEEAANRESMRIERERIDAEKAELARLRAEQEASAKAERDRIEAEQAEERERLEAERAAIQAEKDRLARDQFERDEAERLKREAEEQAEQQRLAAIRAEEDRQAEIKRLEALRPDREKLATYAQSLLSVSCPELDSEDAQALLDSFCFRLSGLISELKSFGN